MKINRRQFVQTSGAFAAAGITAPASIAWAQSEPAKPEQLIVRAWGGSWQEALDKGVSKSFSEQTGIKIAYDTTYHEEMRSKIWQAIAQGRTPPVHVNWDISATAVESALRGVCVDLSDLGNLDEMSTIAFPSDVEGLPYVNMYAYVYALAYSGNVFPDAAPDSWNVMLDPKFRGRVAIYDTGDGTIQTAPIAGGGSREDIPDNMEKGWEWLRKLKANAPLLGKDPDFTKWFQQNEIDIACTIMTNLVPVKQAGIDVRWTVPKESAYVATDCLWVPTGFLDNETYWAKRYISHAMSAPAQEAWCHALGLPGTNKNFRAPAEYAGDPAYPAGDDAFTKLLSISDRVKSQHWKDWSLAFKEIMNA